MIESLPSEQDWRFAMLTLFDDSMDRTANAERWEEIRKLSQYGQHEAFGYAIKKEIANRLLLELLPKNWGRSPMHQETARQKEKRANGHTRRKEKARKILIAFSNVKL